MARESNRSTMRDALRRQPLEANDYNEPCPECPKRGRPTPNPIDLDWGICSQCDGEHAKQCASLPDEEKERLAALSMTPRYPR